MKVVVPVVGVGIAAASCCCCGDFFAGVQEGFNEALEEARGGSAAQVDENGGGVAVSAGDGGASVTLGDGGSAAPSGEFCGRFGEMGLRAPAGFSVTACSDLGGTGGLLLRGSGSPSEACAVMKQWGDATGYSLLSNSFMGDTQAVTYQKNGEILAISCSSVGGETQISVGLTRM